MIFVTVECKQTAKENVTNTTTSNASQGGADEYLCIDKNINNFLTATSIIFTTLITSHWHWPYYN